MESFFNWMENGLISLLFPEEAWYNGDEFDETEVGYILHFNRLVGGFHLVQQRVKSESACGTTPRFCNFYPTIHGEYSFPSTASQTPFGPAWDTAKYKFTPDTVGEYNGGGYMVDFPLVRDLAFSKVRELRSDLWIDKHTRHVMVEFTVFNANLNAFVPVQINFHFRPSGAVHHDFFMISLKLEKLITSADYRRFFFEFVLLICVVVQVFGELKQLWDIKWVFGSVKPYFSSVWNIMDITRCTLFCIDIALYMFLETHPVRRFLTLPMTQNANFTQLAFFEHYYMLLNSFLVLLCVLLCVRLSGGRQELLQLGRNVGGRQLGCECRPPSGTRGGLRGHGGGTPGRLHLEYRVHKDIKSYT